MRFVALILFVCACGASKEQMRREQAAGEALRVDLAKTYVDKKAYDAAIPLLTRLIGEQPREPQLRVLYGTVLREKGLYPQAEGQLQLALKLDPSSADAWSNLGILYDLSRRPTEAEPAHRKAVALAPGEARYWNNLGFSLYVADKNDDAIQALEHALALDPSLTIAYNNLGFAYGKKGDYASAERAFRTAGGEVPAKLNLALVYERNGDDGKAAELRASAKALDPDLQEATP